MPSSYSMWNDFDQLLLLLDVLRQPPETISISHLTDNAAHEELNGPDARVGKVHLPFASSAVGLAQAVAELLLRCCIRDVYLVSKDEEGNTGKQII